MGGGWGRGTGRETLLLVGICDDLQDQERHAHIVLGGPGYQLGTVDCIPECNSLTIYHSCISDVQYYICYFCKYCCNDLSPTAFAR